MRVKIRTVVPSRLDRHLDQMTRGLYDFSGSMNPFPTLSKISPKGIAFFASLLFALNGFAAAQEQKPAAKNGVAFFTDEALKRGLSAPNVFGGVDAKKYIIETTGTGVAIFDYDNDGWPGYFCGHGTTLDPLQGKKASDESSLSQQSRRNIHGRHGKSGLARNSGWGQGVCIGDYDNDGFEDIYVTYYGKNVLYHNNGDGTFSDVSEKGGVAGNRKAWGTGCAFVDYDRDGNWICFVANYVDFDVTTAPGPGERASCM